MFESNPTYYLHVLAMGALAGFTIFLGIPLAFYKGSLKARAFLSTLSVGILLFLFVEISYRLIEGAEIQLQLAAAEMVEGGGALWWHILILVVGFTAGLMGLQVFTATLLMPGPLGKATPPSPRHLAILIALGIGLHNFSEGLVIGQSFITGSIVFGYTLVIGFALHNATEGFGIVAPIAGTSPSVRFLLLACLLAGGPTFVGTLIGVSYTSSTLEALFNALAAGAILYVVVELLEVGRRQGGPLTVGAGLLIGFFLAFGSELVIQLALIPNLAEQRVVREIEIDTGEYYFKPNHLELAVGEPTALVLTNRGTMDHEIEIIGLGGRTEHILPVGKQTRIILNPRHPGGALMICDMPGHLGGGMWGRIFIRESRSSAPPS